VGAGILYAAVMLVAPVLLRGDPNFGFVAIIFLFAVVWTTDVTAYFAGRALGGPKLAPRLSPKKTWSGAAGGAVGAVVAASIVAVMAALPNIVMTALVGFGLSVVSQAGDLFESGLKRHYGAKDAGRLIPGHGGLMDRLDGFIAAALIAVLIGVARGGAEAPARGLLVW
jgi:phosphatidate cytidylyltransferase